MRRYVEVHGGAFVSLVLFASGALMVGSAQAIEPIEPGEEEAATSAPAQAAPPAGVAGPDIDEGTPSDEEREEQGRRRPTPGTQARAPDRSVAGAAATAEGSGADTPRYTLATGERVDDEWARGARFFGGLRSGVGFAPGGYGPAGTLGLELGVSAKRGLGFGLHLLGIYNPPQVILFDIPKAEWGMGAAADVRWYIQTIRPLTLYPTMSLGFMAGPSEGSGENAVLPMVNPGFGARVNIADVYVAFEIGAANFYIPFVNLSVGWEPQHRDDEG